MGLFWSLADRVMRNQRLIERELGLLPPRLREMPAQMAEIALLSVDEVAAVLGVSRKIVDHHIHQGELVGVRVGNSRKFRLADIRDFQERQSASPKVVPLPVARKRPAKPASALGPDVSGELDRLLGRRGG